jgi:hypothetical protein
MARDTLILVAVVAVVTALAMALGAANLGTALAFGTMAFVVALMGLLLRS